MFYKQFIAIRVGSKKITVSDFIPLKFYNHNANNYFLLIISILTNLLKMAFFYMQMWQHLEECNPFDLIIKQLLNEHKIVLIRSEISLI